MTIRATTTPMRMPCSLRACGTSGLIIWSLQLHQQAGQSDVYFGSYLTSACRPRAAEARHFPCLYDVDIHDLVPIEFLAVGSDPAARHDVLVEDARCQSCDHEKANASSDTRSLVLQVTERPASLTKLLQEATSSRAARASRTCFKLCPQRGGSS